MPTTQQSWEKYTESHRKDYPYRLQIGIPLLGEIWKQIQPDSSYRGKVFVATPNHSVLDPVTQRPTIDIRAIWDYEVRAHYPIAWPEVTWKSYSKVKKSWPRRVKGALYSTPFHYNIHVRNNGTYNWNNSTHHSDMYPVDDMEAVATLTPAQKLQACIIESIVVSIKSDHKEDADAANEYFLRAWPEVNGVTPKNYWKVRRNGREAL
ncbi:MAG: hypothetical protein AAF146_10410 [Bacteroidota bacterium]